VISVDEAQIGFREELRNDYSPNGSDASLIRFEQVSIWQALPFIGVTKMISKPLRGKGKNRKSDRFKVVDEKFSGRIFGSSFRSEILNLSLYTLLSVVVHFQTSSISGLPPFNLNARVVETRSAADHVHVLRTQRRRGASVHR